MEANIQKRFEKTFLGQEVRVLRNVHTVADGSVTQDLWKGEICVIQKVNFSHENGRHDYGWTLRPTSQSLKKNSRRFAMTTVGWEDFDLISSTDHPNNLYY